MCVCVCVFKKSSSSRKSTMFGNNKYLLIEHINEYLLASLIYLIIITVDFQIIWMESVHSSLNSYFKESKYSLHQSTYFIYWALWFLLNGALHSDSHLTNIYCAPLMTRKQSTYISCCICQEHLGVLSLIGKCRVSSKFMKHLLKQLVLH